jgi:hypothetical protein
LEKVVAKDGTSGNLDNTRNRMQNPKIKINECCFTDFKLVVDVIYALESLHHVNTGGVAYISEIYASSIFRVQMSKVTEWSAPSSSPWGSWFKIYT